MMYYTSYVREDFPPSDCWTYDGSHEGHSDGSPTSRHSSASEKPDVGAERLRVCQVSISPVRDMGVQG